MITLIAMLIGALVFWLILRSPGWANEYLPILDRRNKWDDALDNIRRCPWKEDIFIDRTSFVSSGAYGLAAGPYHAVSISADGPNADGQTFHHGYIGHWGDCGIISEANELAERLCNAVAEITGRVPPIYYTEKQKNAHASWCMSGRRRRPAGVSPNRLPQDIAEYE
jgi:hypothetical protein